MLIGERGRPPVLAHDVRSVITAPWQGRHSGKPEEAYEAITRLSPGPYAELFARYQRAGWQCFGAELAVAAPGSGQFEFRSTSALSLDMRYI
jgi:N6-adenosine-specific RNA methylase IME4